MVGEAEDREGRAGRSVSEPDKHAPVPGGHAGWSVGDTSPNNPRLTVGDRDPCGRQHPRFMRSKTRWRRCALKPNQDGGRRPPRSCR